MFGSERVKALLIIALAATMVVIKVIITIAVVLWSNVKTIVSIRWLFAS